MYLLHDKVECKTLHSVSNVAIHKLYFKMPAKKPQEHDFQRKDLWKTLTVVLMIKMKRKTQMNALQAIVELCSL